ncbi:MAG TPA: hydrogenase maturation nickel metallochaperone HypA [Bacteroidales bacterium]|jgi:hydrogenase nickel incorporation protein HypA/HybF|nr:hydrogenase maturation nickel metallochaperone HypA [Bacteroidales bacterium]
MHELSLAEEVIRLAGSEAISRNAVSVSEITLEIGNLSGIDADAFEHALLILSENSIIDKSGIKIIRKKGTGICRSCGTEFEMECRITECPGCHSLPGEIRGGSEFRVVSLVVELEDST